METLNKYSYILSGIFILLIITGIILKFQGCGKQPANTTVVTPLKVQTPSTEDQTFVPEGLKAVGRLDIKNQNERPNKWTKKDTHIVIAADQKCNTCVSYIQIDKIKMFVGFDFEAKIYLGYNTSVGLNIGYDQGIYRVGKFSLDGLISFPTFGLGLGYNLTNNLQALIGGQYSYGGYNKLEDFSSYYFAPVNWGMPAPMAGLSFAF